MVTYIHYLIVLSMTISIGGRCQTFIPQGGLTFSTSTLRSADTKPHHTDVDFRQGYTAGVAVQFPNRGKQKMQSGIFYTQKGGKSNHIAQDGSLKAIHTFDIMLKYIEVPILFKFTLNESERSEFYLKTGPGIAYWIGGTADRFYSYSTGTGAPAQESITGRIKYDGTRSGPSGNDFYVTRRVEANVHLGFGVLIHHKINLDLISVFGLSEQEFFFDAMAKNIVIQCSIGTPLRMNAWKD